MILTSWYSMRNAILRSTSSGTITVITPWRTLLGNTVDAITGTISYRGFLALVRPIIGTGSGVPAQDDYNMFEDARNSVAQLALNISYGIDYSDSPCERTTYIISGVNNTSDNLTLTEYGLYVYASSAIGIMNEGWLIIHEMLNTPITVAPGESFSIPFAWYSY